MRDLVMLYVILKRRMAKRTVAKIFEGVDKLKGIRQESRFKDEQILFETGLYPINSIYTLY